MTIGVALIGSGIFAKEYHLPAIQATPLLTLKAAYSRSLKSVQGLQTTAEVDLYTDDSGAGKTYHDLLLRPDISAVIIALPILSQPEYIEAALAAGKHVLSEKPIAADLKKAHKLVEYYKSDKVKGGATWAVAENMRYLEAFEYAAEAITKIGRITGFNLQSLGLTKIGTKYFETAWRKVPEYQGGFLLDGGIHQVAALRFLLGREVIPTSLTAFSVLLQEHLPPVDTLTSIWQTSTGVPGTFHLSFGSTQSFRDTKVIGENGSVSLVGDDVIVRDAEGKETVKKDDFEWKDYGVKSEVAVWAASIEAGKPDPRQSPEEGLADLEILEKMLRSGEEGGKPQSLSLQI